MTVEIIIVLVILICAVLLFITEKLPVEIVGLLVMSTLLLTGILTPEEGLTGFSNPATITVGAMFVLSAGLFKTGALNRVAELFTRLAERGEAALLLGLMGVIGLLSAFINNTAAVAIFADCNCSFFQNPKKPIPFIDAAFICLDVRRRMHFDWNIYEYIDQLNR